jgi:hypothetical protein
VTPDVQPGEEIEVEVTPKNFGRIARPDREAGDDAAHPPGEKEMIYDEFKDRAGEIVSGTGAPLRALRCGRGSRQVRGDDAFARAGADRRITNIGDRIGRMT